MFTQRAGLLLTITGITLSLAWITQLELVYLISAILISIIIISFLIFNFTLVNISCQRQLPKTAYEDDEINVRVTLKNKSILPNYFIYLLDNFSADRQQHQEKRILIPYLPGKKVINWNYQSICHKRGEYWIGPFTLIASDPLGLFKKYRSINISSRLTVYPKIFNIRELPSFIKGMVTPRFGSQTIRKSGDYEEYYGIREYRREDGLRKIHWPLSARHGELMVRHFEQSGSYQVTILLDLNQKNNLGKGKEATLEYAIKIAASLSRYFLDRRAEVQVIGRSEKPLITLPGRSPSHLFTILQTLAQTEASGYYSLDKALSQLNPLIWPNSTLIVITLDRDRQVLQSIERTMYSKNVSMIYVLLIASSFAKDIRPATLYLPFSRAQDIKIYHIKCGQNLEASFSSVLV